MKHYYETVVIGVCLVLCLIVGVYLFKHSGDQSATVDLVTPNVIQTSIGVEDNSNK